MNVHNSTYRFCIGIHNGNAGTCKGRILVAVIRLMIVQLYHGVNGIRIQWKSLGI